MIDGVDVLLMLAVVALAFVAQYALRRHAREQSAPAKSGDFLWPLDHDLDPSRGVRGAYDEGVLRRASAARFRELIGECDEAS